MTTLLAVLEFKDYMILAVIVAVFGGGAGYMTTYDRRRLEALSQKLDALLKHHGIEWPPPLGPSGLSLEVQQLASNPSTHIAAIKRYREENPKVGLAEAKARIESFYNSQSKPPTPAQ